MKEISGFLFRGCAKLQSVTIPESVQAIGKYAFCDCRSLQSVTIPRSVKKIEKKSFQRLPSAHGADCAVFPDFER